jgi:integral membrane sensor domain MASE1
MAQAAIGGTALRRTIGYRAPFENDRAPFENARDFLVYLLLAPLLCLTSATISLGGLWALAAVELRDLPMNWTTWWLGDTLGVLLALPLVVVLAEYSENAVLGASRQSADSFNPVEATFWQDAFFR